MYLSGDSSVGEAAAPDGRCTPILLMLSFFRLVLGGTSVVYEVSPGKESLFRSLLVSSMEQVVCMFCLRRRGGEIWDGGYALYMFCGTGNKVCRARARLKWARSVGGVG